MADDWKPGDLALCVRRDGGGNQRLRFINPGEKVTVSRVAANPEWPAVGLSFQESGCFFTYYDSRCFRKIHPHTPDAEDAETIRLLTGKPVREPVA